MNFILTVTYNMQIESYDVIHATSKHALGLLKSVRSEAHTL